MSTETQLLDSHAAPTGFGNAAPFKKKSKVKDPVGSALKALGICATILCLLAAAMAFLTM